MKEDCLPKVWENTKLEIVTIFLMCDQSDIATVIKLEIMKRLTKSHTQLFVSQLFRNISSC